MSGAPGVLGGSEQRYVISLYCLDFDRCSAAKGREPWPLTIFEFAQDSGLEVDYRNNPFILVFGAVVSGCQNRNLRLTDFFAMHILHLVITRYEHPAVFIAELNNFRIRNVSEWTAFRISEPFRKSLNSKSCRSEPSSYRLSRKAFVEK
jgi:hypothetical protein